MELTSNPNESSKNLVAGENKPLAGGENLPPVVRGFVLLPRGRQITVIVSLASALALAVALLLWSQQPNFERLYGNMPEKEAGEVVEALKKLNMEYRLDERTGAILVPNDKVHELRLKLAAQGLPRETGSGFELLDKETSFGSSQMMETSRFQRALEGEIARSITSIRSVKSARVHLALPKESVFVRQARKPSASVVLELNSGSLEQDQVDAIVHLVAASVPQLEPEQVAVVDQRGRLLNSRDAASGLNLTSKQFNYKKQVEDHLIDRVDNILTPMVGPEGLRTQVSADLDFAVTERTQEIYNPDLPALRSEQTSEEQLRQGSGVQGVPGALSNQPPPAGVAPEVAPGQPATPGQAAASGQAAAPGQPGAEPTPAPKPEVINTSKSATRNYDLDKTISHSRLSTGEIRRLTVAVVVDNRRVLQPDGTFASQPYSEEDLGRFTNLVKEAVGFDAARGDRVTVTNAEFHQELEPPPAQVWEQPWFWSVAKQAGAALFLLILVFAVLRPAIKGLANRAAIEAERVAAVAAQGPSVTQEAVQQLPGAAQAAGGEPLMLGGGGADEMFLLEAPQSYEKRLEFAQKAIDQDPKRVAQVLKTWLNTNG